MASRMARVTTRYRCGHCCKFYPQLVDPRGLPCLHVFCLPCLKTSLLIHETRVRCSECRIIHDITDVTALPKSNLNDPLEEEVEDETDIVYCDLCEETPTRAVTFCVESQKKLCQQDMQDHQKHIMRYLGIEHKFVPIEEYLQAPHKYVSVKCAQHPDHPEKEACSVCHTRFCVRCIPAKKVCRDEHGEDNPHHDVQSLHDLSEELRRRLDKKSESLAVKIAEVDKIEKEAWNKLADIEYDAEQMVLKIERLTEEKIEAIIAESEKLKKEIAEYVRESVQIVEEFAVPVLDKWYEMQCLWNSIQEIINHSNDSDVVRMYREKSDELECAEDISMIDHCTVIPESLVPTNKEGYLGQKLLRIPNSVQFTDPLTAGREWCYTVNTAVDGRVLCRTSSGVEIIDPDTLNVIKSVKNTDTVGWWEIIQPCHDMIGCWYNKKEELCEVAILNPNSLQKIRTIYKTTQGGLSRLAQHGSDVYITAYEEKILIVCSLIDNKGVLKIPLTDMVYPVPICVLPDSTILIGDWVEDGKVIRYTLDKAAGQLTKVWTSHPIDEPTGIAYDNRDELIYVNTWGGQIYIISLEGSVLRTISGDVVVSYVHYIAVTPGGQILLACLKEGLKRYRLKY